MSVTGRVGVNTLELDKGYESFFWGGGHESDRRSWQLPRSIAVNQD